MDEKGEWLRGRLGASKVMEANQLYGEEDLKNLDRFASQLSTEKRRKESTSQELDKNTTLVLPKGWKSRKMNTKKGRKVSNPLM